MVASDKLHRGDVLTEVEVAHVCKHVAPGGKMQDDASSALKELQRRLRKVEESMQKQVEAFAILKAQ